MAPSSVGDVTSLRGLPFLAGSSLESTCPCNLLTGPLRSYMEVRSASNAANGHIITFCARGSISL